MVKNRLIDSITLIIAAAGIDLTIGDPRWCPHPVEVMGYIINWLRNWVEYWARDNAFMLRVGGFLITIILVLVSGLTGWFLEQVVLSGRYLNELIGSILLAIALASGISTRSLNKSVKAVIKELPSNSKQTSPEKAQKRLSLIVGRDVKNLDESEILRAAAETSSENYVDGVFAPLFWIFIGIALWQISTNLPGPLSLVWIFKASSTIDSMLGYKKGKLKWLGTAGAKLDDLLTWIPCRLVVITLPIFNAPLNKIPLILKSAWADGIKDQSPNSGLSEAIFAYCANVKMGGINRYDNKLKIKPILAPKFPVASKESVIRILNMGIKLEIIWLIAFALIFYIMR